MKLNRILIAASCVLGCMTMASAGFAQPEQAAAHPVDGQMVRLDAKKLWKFSYLPNLKMKNVQKVAEKLRHPSISPDGRHIVMFDRDADNLENNRLYEWNDNTLELREIVRGSQVSMFVDWQDDESILMRERDKPFFREGAKLNYSIGKKPMLRGRKPIADNDYVVYDESDIIILESKKTKTLQAISDSRADRYFAPILSPDEKYVVFSSLSSGIHLFDIETNAVVFIGSNGIYPSFSPDGRYLIYTTNRDDGHNFTSGDLVLIDLQKRSYRYISNPNNEIRINATISRDAKQIAYETDDGNTWRASLNAE